MALNKIYTTLFLLVFVLNGFVEAAGFTIDDIKYELVTLSGYEDEVLDPDHYNDQEEKKSALILRNNLSRFDNISSELENKDKVELLKLFVYFLDVVNSKIEILRVLSNDSVFLNDINSLKLILTSAFYDQLERYAGLISNSSCNDLVLEINDIINDFVTKQVLDFLEKKEIKVTSNDLLNVDLCNLWSSLFKRYFAVVKAFSDNKYNFDEKELDLVLEDLKKQRDILLKIDFTKGLKKEIFGNWIIVKELRIQRTGEQADFVLPQGNYDSSRFKMEKQLKDSIELFNLFILNLLKIRHDHYKFKELADKIKSLSAEKKEIMIRHLVLTQKEEFQKLKQSAELFDIFDRYSKIVKEYLDSEKINKDLFAYELLSVIGLLKNIKNANDPDGIWYLITGSKNKKSDMLCSVFENMIQILELINFQLSDVSAKKPIDSGVWNLAEKILSSKKAADLLAGFIN